MNTTPSGTATAADTTAGQEAPLTHEGRAAAFARAVHAELSDLPVEDRDELLDGLEADLFERFAEGDAPGDPVAYAAELRTAAGLPPRADPESGRGRRTVRERVDAVEARLTAWAEGTPARRAVREFIGSLRPVWWVLRGLGVMAAVLMISGSTVYMAGLPFPKSSFLAALVGSITVLTSVQWGRGKWLPRSWMVWIRRLGDVVAVVTLAALLLAVATTPMSPSAGGEVETLEGQPGLSSNGGQQISNIYAYDCNGKLLDGVRLFDQDGRPVATTIGGEWGPEGAPPPGWDEARQQNIEYLQNGLADPGVWNVFPLKEKRSDTQGNFVPGGTDPFSASPKESLVPLSTACPTPGTSAAGKDAARKDAAGKDAARKDAGGKDQAGKDQAGKDPAGEDPATDTGPAE